MDTHPDDSVAASALVGAGCFSAIAGFFGGGMIGVLIAWIVGSVRRCEAPTGVPACDWNKFALVGMLVGIVLVPVVSIMRLRGRRS
ncbi:MAG: hypothetical protein ACR2M1_13290 [Gemmatimonadaceae bacterium]